MIVWLGAAAFAVFAAAALVLGARRPMRGETPAPAQVFAASRRDLRADATAQALSPETASALEVELALAVADATPASSAPLASTASDGADAPAAPPLLPLLGGALAVAALALALYAVWGEPQAELLADSARLMAAAPTPEQLTVLADALAARTRRVPHDADAWLHLGSARFRQRDFDGAAQAFAALHDLAGANEQVDMAWAQARYLADDGAIAPATQAIIDRVLAVRSEQPDMLELMAMRALRGSDFAGASRLLARILRQPLAARRREQLTETLELARQRLDPERALIEVTVRAPAEPPAWLMVFARPVGGVAPLAVVRQPAKPIQTILLDDANGMTEAAPLGSAEQVEVVARLSRTGAADAALAEAVSEPVSPGAQPRLTLTLRRGPADRARAVDTGADRLLQGPRDPARDASVMVGDQPMAPWSHTGVEFGRARPGPTSSRSPTEVRWAQVQMSE